MNSPLVLGMDDLYLYSTCPKWYCLSKTPGMYDIHATWIASLDFKRDLFKLVLKSLDDENNDKTRLKFHLEVRKLYASYFYRITPGGLSLSEEIRIAHTIACFKNLVIRFREYKFNVGRKIQSPYILDGNILCELAIEPIAVFTNTGSYLRYVFVVEESEWCMSSLGRRFEHAVVPYIHSLVEDDTKVDVYYVNPTTLDLCKVKYNKKLEMSRLDTTIKSLVSGYSGKAYIGGICQKCPFNNVCKPWEQVEVLEKLGKITV